MKKIILVLVIVLLALLAILGFRIYGKPDYLKESVVAKGALLPTPNASSTQNELRAWNDLVRANAVASNSIEFTDCKPSPKIISVKQGSKIDLVNKGNKAITVTVLKLKFTAEATSTGEMYADFSRGAGIYTYSCNGSRAVGALVVN